MATAATIQPTPAHQSEPIFSSSLDTSTKSQGVSVPRGPTRSNLVFYKAPADGAVPFNYVEQPPEGEPQRNYGEDEHEVQINDMRGRETEFTLDRNSFATVAGVESDEKDFTDDEHIKNVYYPEVEKVILDNVPGAYRVLIFDHTIRRGKPGEPANFKRTPVTRVHIDQTPRAAGMRVEYHLPDEAEELKRGRYRIINVWRPLNGPVVAHPLAVADSATVENGDVVGVEHRYPHRTGETAGVKYNPNHAFYYLSGMRNDERLLLQCSDSTNARGRLPHTAFVDPRTPDGAPNRQSVEVRALVFG